MSAEQDLLLRPVIVLAMPLKQTSFHLFYIPSLLLSILPMAEKNILLTDLQLFK